MTAPAYFPEASRRVGANPTGSLRQISLAVRAKVLLFSEASPAPSLMVACSGGADSLALAVCVLDQASRLGLPVAATIVDHGLRPESASEAVEVAETLKELGFPRVFIRRVEVGSEFGPEADARTARYAALTIAAQEFAGDNPAVVFLGHTLDDQAETVLLGLARGAGSRSLSGMPESFTAGGVEFVRPLLGLRRSDTAEACHQLNLTPVVDPSNFPDGPWRAADGSALRRAALRHRVLPELAAVFGRDLQPNLARTASQLREDNRALDEWATQVFTQVRMEPARALEACTASLEKNKSKTDPARPNEKAENRESLGEIDRVRNHLSEAKIILDVGQLKQVPAAVLARVLRKAAVEAGAIRGELTYTHTHNLRRLVSDYRGQGPLQLPGSVSVQRLRLGPHLAVLSFTGL